MWIIPTANAWGYSHFRREEVGIDVNRDFPYDQEPEHCMQSVAARILKRSFSRAYISYCFDNR
eukprot:UN08833